MHFRIALACHIFQLTLFTCSELCQWLWPILLQKELQQFMDSCNAARMRKDKTKAGPSGMSCDQAFTFLERWGERNCLLPVDLAVIREMKEALGGDKLLEFVSPEFSQKAQAVYDSSKISELTFQNVWLVFATMYPLIFL
jgi:hypothetical protein